MRKAQKRQAEELVRQMEEAHDQIKKFIEQGSIPSAMELLEECQNGGITLGTLIENTEGDGHPTVLLLEEYCELVYQVHEDLTNNKNIISKKIYKILRQKLIRISNSIKNDIRIKIEVAFFPYKASMWDSLESVYLTAREDPECDAYCVPIPYYDLNPDHSFGEMHYEGGEYPREIVVTDWQSYDFEERRPDVIYIHNPYDNCNLVTSVHPRFYSFNLKKYTDTLVYIPYYVTSGGMLEAQSMFPSYYNIDYIVIQSSQFREYFDKNIPDEKFLAFGSPKVDKVISKCKNLSEPSKVWIRKMTDKTGRRKRVIFYNTGISAMLKNTEGFLKKMEYVFKCFMDREDVCLLWRPHPLLEDTFDSMRPEFRPIYDTLKKAFVENSLGIYDTSPDIEESIALSDAYIGDAGTSVTALFGVAGKPIFILNNRIIDELEDWRNKIKVEFNFYDQNQFAIIQGNKLYMSGPDQYYYRYFCDLPEDAYVNHYYIVSELNGKWYACPFNAQHILVIGKTGIEKKIELKKEVDGDEIFSFPRRYGKYILLIPVNYPAVVRYDTVTGEIKYFTENIDGFVKEKNNQKITAGSLVYRENLYIASPVDNMVYKLDIESGESSMIELPIQSRCGGHLVVEYGGEIWLTPYDGQVIVRWNPETNEVREYEGVLKDFLCRNIIDDSVCTEIPFFMPAFYENYVYLPPCQANMPLKLNMDTGEFERWAPVLKKEEDETENLGFNESFTFIDWKLKDQESSFKIYLFSRRRLYDMNSDGSVFQEIPIQVDLKDIENNEPGFSKYSETLPYACIENRFNTLNRFLGGKTVGNPFIQEKQIEVYKDIIVNYDGGCGKKVHEFVRNIEK